MPAKPEQPKDLEIIKFRNNRKSITIEWTEGTDSVSRTFHDNPLPSFYKALEGLNPHVLTLCELPAKDLEKVSATGITVSHKGENSDALIVARKKIRKGKRVFNISTPLLPMYPSEEEASLDHMDEEEAKAIEKVIKEATKYILGERAQGQIDFQEEEEAEPKRKAKGADNSVEFPALDTPAAEG